MIENKRKWIVNYMLLTLSIIKDNYPDLDLELYYNAEDFEEVLRREDSDVEISYEGLINKTNYMPWCPLHGSKSTINCGNCGWKARHNGCATAPDSTFSRYHEALNLKDLIANNFPKFKSLEPKIEVRPPVPEGAQRLELRDGGYVDLKVMKFIDRVQLVAVNEEGERKPCGIICSLRTDGKLNIASNVDEDLGLQLDSHRRVKTANC